MWSTLTNENGFLSLLACLFGRVFGESVDRLKENDDNRPPLVSLSVPLIWFLSSSLSCFHSSHSLPISPTMSVIFLSCHIDSILLVIIISFFTLYFYRLLASNPTEIDFHYQKKIGKKASGNRCGLRAQNTMTTGASNNFISNIHNIWKERDGEGERDRESKR